MVNEEVTMTMSVLPGAMTGISTLMAGMVSINNVFMDMTRQIDSTFGLVDATVITAGTVIAQFGFQAAQAFGEFEQGMKIVQMVSGQTKQDIYTLSQAANQFSVQYRTDIDQITEGLQTLGRAGLNSAAEQTEVLQNGLNTAKLESRDLNSVLEELIQNTALLGGNLKESNFGEDSQYVNDLLVATSMTAPITTHDVSETLKYSGGIAAAAGAHIRDNEGNEDEQGKAILEDYMGAIAAFAQKGVTGSIAGTALRAFFNKPATQDASVTEALESIHLKPEYLWEDDEETMKPVSEQIRIIKDQMEELNVSTMDQLQIWSKIVGGKMGQQMMKLESDDIKDLTNDIRAADDASNLAAGSMQTFQANMKEMGEQGQVAFRSFGENVARFINPFIDIITKVLELLSNPISSAALFSGFLLAIGKVVSTVKKLFSNLKAEFSDFMSYFRSGETLMAIKPSTERGLRRKGVYSDYTKAEAPKEVSTVKGLVDSFKASAQEDRLQYLRDSGLTDSQIAAQSITSKWSSDKLVKGTMDSKIMDKAITQNLLTKEQFNDIFILTADEWREKYKNNIQSLAESLGKANEDVKQIEKEVQKGKDDIEERLENYKKKKEEIRSQKSSPITDSKGGSGTSAIGNKMEDNPNDYYTNSVTPPMVTAAQKANKAREKVNQQVGKDINNIAQELIDKGDYKKFMEIVDSERENKIGLDSKYLNFGHALYDLNKTMIEKTATVEGKSFPRSELGIDWDKELIVPKIEDIPNSFSDSKEYLEFIEATKKAHEETKTVNKLGKEYFDALNNELAAFALDLEKPGFKHKTLQEEQFDEFYNKQKSKKLDSMGIPITKQDKVLLSPDLIRDSFISGLVPNISKKDFENLPLSTGGVVSEIFNNPRALENAYDNFSKLLENQLRKYLDFIAPTMGTGKNNTFSDYVQGRTMLEAPAGSGPGEWSYKRIANQIRDLYGIESFENGEIPFFRGEWDGNANLNKKEIASRAYPYLADWSITKRDDSIIGVSDDELKEMAVNLGFDSKDWKGNRQEKIKKINSFLSNKLSPQAQAWLDDYETISATVEAAVEPVVQENQRLKKDIERMKNEVQELKERREKREALNNWDPVEEGRKRVEEHDNLLKEKREKIKDDLDGKYWAGDDKKEKKYPAKDTKPSLEERQEYLEEFYNPEQKPYVPKNAIKMPRPDVEFEEALNGIIQRSIHRFVPETEEQKRKRLRIRDEDFNRRDDFMSKSSFAGMSPGTALNLAASGVPDSAKPEGFFSKLSTGLSNKTEGLVSGIGGFFANAKERLTRTREGRMLGYAKPNTTFQKGVNVAGNLLDLAGGPLMVAMEGLTLAINAVQSWYQSYTEDLKKALSDVKEAYSERKQAEDQIKQTYREQNPDADKEAANDYVLKQYGKMYDSLMKNGNDFSEWIKKTSQKTDLTKKYEVDSEKDDGSMKEVKEEEKSEEEALKEAIKENNSALYEATAQLQLATNKLVTKMEDGVWGIDGFSSELSDSLGSAQDTWLGFTDGSGSIENGFLKTASQKDENYAGDTELTGLMLEDFKDSQGDWRQGLRKIFGSDFDDITSTMNTGATKAMKSMGQFANSLGKQKNARLQSSMMNDRKSWQGLAKEMAKYEKKTGKHAMNVADTKNTRMENLIKKLQIDTHLSRAQVIAAAQLQQLQDMYQVSEQSFVPLMATQAETASRLYNTTAEGIAPQAGSAAGGAVGTEQNSAAIAAYLSVMAQNAALEAAYQQDVLDGNTTAKSKEEYLQEAAGQHIKFGFNIQDEKGLKAGTDPTFVGIDTTIGEDKEKQKRIAHALEYQGDRIRNPEWTDQEVSNYSKRIDKLIDKGMSFSEAMKKARENYAGAAAPQLEAAYLGSSVGEEEDSGSGGGSGSGSGDKDKNNTGTRKERVDLVLCSKKEIPKLNVNLFKKPPTFTVLNKNFKVRDVKINTEDTPKAIMSAIKNSFIDVQKRSDPKIIQDEEGVYNPEQATDGNPLPSGSAKTRTD